MVKVFISVTKWFLLLLATLVVTFIVVNWQDEPLKPEVQAVLDWQPPADYAIENGYLILLGIDAPANAEATKVGLTLLQADIERFKQFMQSHVDLPAQRSDAVPQFFDWKASRCDYLKQTSCVDFYQQLDHGQVDEIKLQYSAILSRFDAIKKSRNYIEVIPPSLSAQLPHYAELVNASEFNRIEAVRLIGTEQVPIGVSHLIENAQFSRRMMKESNSLLSHMIAVKLVQRDAQLISELLAKYPHLAKTYKAQFLPLLASINTPEFSLNKAFINERNITLPTMYNLKFVGVSQLFSMANKSAISTELSDDSSGSIDLIYQGNAASNLMFELGNLRLVLANAQPSQLTQVAADFRAKQARYFRDCLPNKICFKNPVGKILAGIAEPDFLSYVQRHHDAEGQLRLVSLQLEILTAESKAQYAALLAQYPNPYTLKPMTMNNDAGQLVFEGKWRRAGEENGQIYQVNLKPTLQ